MVLGNKSLAYLTVDSRGISPADASLVASFFRHWNGVDCGIVCLSLDGVVLGSAFSLFITRFLSNNSNLVELELRGTDQGRRAGLRIYPVLRDPAVVVEAY